MPATTRYSLNDRQELAGLARNLRRAKRQMFLKEVEAPQTSVDSFRDLVTRSVMSDLVDGHGSSSSFSNSSTEFNKKLIESPRRHRTSLKVAVQNAQGPRAA